MSFSHKAIVSLFNDESVSARTWYEIETHNADANGVSFHFSKFFVIYDMLTDESEKRLLKNIIIDDFRSAWRLREIASDLCEHDLTEMDCNVICDEIDNLVSVINIMSLQRHAKRLSHPKATKLDSDGRIQFIRAIDAKLREYTVAYDELMTTDLWLD